MDIITLLILSVLIIFLFLWGYRYVAGFYSEKNSQFDSLITGVFIISEKEKNAEIVLRELFMYLQRNEIRCFSVIYIINKAEDKNIQYVCEKICSEYSLFKMADASSIKI